MISLVELSNELFGPTDMMTIPHVSFSICFMNTFSSFLGAIPSCHGAGGLASQYRYGARTGRSMLVLGIFKIIVAIFMGYSLNQILDRFPRSVMGMLLIGSGVELATHGMKKLPTTNGQGLETHKTVFTISVATVMATNTFYGYLIGILLLSLGYLQDRFRVPVNYSIINEVTEL